MLDLLLAAGMILRELLLHDLGDVPPLVPELLLQLEQPAVGLRGTRLVGSGARDIQLHFFTAILSEGYLTRPCSPRLLLHCWLHGLYAGRRQNDR